MIKPRPWLPTPLLSILLLVVWLLLVRSTAFGQFLLGGLLARRIVRPASSGSSARKRNGANPKE